MSPCASLWWYCSTCPFLCLFSWVTAKGTDGMGAPGLEWCSIRAGVAGEFLNFRLQHLIDALLEFGRKEMLRQKGHSIFHLCLRVLGKSLQYFHLGCVKLNITMSLLIVEETLDERLLLEHLVSEDEFCIQQIGLGVILFISLSNLPSSAQKENNV